MPEPPPTTWRVVRVSGALPPGFSKHFHPTPSGPAPWTGVTRWLGIPIDRVDVVPRGDRWALRYRHLPVLDVLAAHPGVASPDTASIAAEAFLRLPGGRLLRFCRFRLER